MMKEKRVKRVNEKIEKISQEAKKSHNYERQTKIVVIAMIVLIILILIFYWIIRASQKFEYHGLEFYKEKEGSITYYKSLLGYISSSGKNIPFILKLRNDPRDLDEMPVESKIALKKEVILSLDPKIGNCSDIYSTLVDFGMTLNGFSRKATTASIDIKYAEENGIPYADCKSNPDKTVIIMKQSNETKIYAEEGSSEGIVVVGGDDFQSTESIGCYIIEISDCQVRESFERFILSFIENLYSK